MSNSPTELLLGTFVPKAILFVNDGSLCLELFFYFGRNCTTYEE